MSGRNELIGAVDFGARRVRVLIGHRDGDSAIEIVGHGAADSHGCISQGVIQDLGAAQRAYGQALRDAEKEARGQARSMYVGVHGRNVQTHIREGLIELDDEAVDEDHLEAAREKALAGLTENDDFVSTSATSQEWYINDLRVKNPLGIRGRTLKTRIHVACLPSLIEDNLVACIESYKRDFDDAVFMPLAAAAGALTPEDLELGAACIDLGYRNTGLAVYRDYRVVGTGCFEWGGYHITRDVAAGLQISFEEAEELIAQYGISRAALHDPESDGPISQLQAPDNEPRIKLRTAVPEAPDIVDRAELEAIIVHRAAEMIERVRKHCESRDLIRHIVRGVVLTGGASTIGNLNQLAEMVLRMPCRRGAPVNMTIVPHGVDTPEFAPAAGILRQAYDMRDAERRIGRHAGPMGALLDVVGGGVKRFFW